MSYYANRQTRVKSLPCQTVAEVTNCSYWLLSHYKALCNKSEMGWVCSHQNLNSQTRWHYPWHLAAACQLLCINATTDQQVLQSYVNLNTGCQRPAMVAIAMNHPHLQSIHVSNTYSVAKITSNSNDNNFLLANLKNWDGFFLPRDTTMLAWCWES